MVKKNSKKAKLVQPRPIMVALASIIAGVLVASSIYFLVQAAMNTGASEVFTLTKILTVALVLSALAPIAVGLFVYKTAQGRALRRYFVAATYMAIYWLAEYALSAITPLLPLPVDSVGAQTDFIIGVVFFTPIILGTIFALGIYLGSKKRTMNVNHWGLTLFLAIIAALLVFNVVLFFNPTLLLPN